MPEFLAGSHRYWSIPGFAPSNRSTSWKEGSIEMSASHGSVLSGSSLLHSLAWYVTRAVHGEMEVTEQVASVSYGLSRVVQV